MISLKSVVVRAMLTIPDECRAGCRALLLRWSRGLGAGGARNETYTTAGICHGGSGACRILSQMRQVLDIYAIVIVFRFSTV